MTQNLFLLVRGVTTRRWRIVHKRIVLAYDVVAEPLMFPVATAASHQPKSMLFRQPPEPVSTATTPRLLRTRLRTSSTDRSHFDPPSLALQQDLMSRHQPSGFATSELASNTRSKTALLPPRHPAHTNESNQPHVSYQLLQTFRPTNTPMSYPNLGCETK
jgi:hypothetical protein